MINLFQRHKLQPQEFLVGGKHALRVGLLRSSAGNAIGDFTGILTGIFICELALDDKSLSEVKKVYRWSRMVERLGTM
jgi:hypothetical protein